MDLRRLRYFVVVAEERSISRAARRLHMAQPPLSAQLQNLERDLGVDLFTRHRRGVELTEAGAELARHARRLLGDVEAVTEAVRGVGQGASGRLTLAFVPALGATLLPDLLRRLRADLPAVVLDLFQTDLDADLDANLDPVTQRVAGRRADAGLVYLSPAGPAEHPHDAGHSHDLEVAVVDRVPMVAFLPAGHPMAAGDRADLTQLAGHTLLVPGLTGRGALVDGARHACRLAGVTPAAERGVALVQTTVGLVAAGLGIALLPANTPRLPGVTVLSLRHHVPPVETAVLWRRDEPPNPVLARFLRLALATPEPDVLGPDKARPHADR
jgi:DNA-binding transcriptional LysR family regulator